MRPTGERKSSHSKVIEMLAAEDNFKFPDFSKLEKDTAFTAAKALDELFLKAQGIEWRNRYEAALSEVKPIEGGDPTAIRNYAQLVREHVKKLNSLITTHRGMLLPYSQKCFNWPVNFSTRKAFGDDAKDIISKLQVGAQTIANDDPKARFNPKSRFGKIALDVLGRIESCRTESPSWFSSMHEAKEPWRKSAKTLAPFPTKSTDHDKRKLPPNKLMTDEEIRKKEAVSEAKRKWLAVMEQALESDFRDPETASSYLSLLAAPSYKRNRRRKAAFFDKIRRVFETFW